MGLLWVWFACCGEDPAAVRTKGASDAVAGDATGDVASGPDVTADGLSDTGSDGARAHACATDAECDSTAPGDKCLGAWGCVEGSCQPKPGTAVVCDAGDDTVCAKVARVPETGSCVTTAVNPGTACDDGDACTGPDACAVGGCAGAKVACDDANPCTADTCEQASGCQHAATTAPCDDGDACTAGDVCKGGSCTASPLACDDGKPCTDDTCEPNLGCVQKNNSLACDDGSKCTGSDTCSAGACVGTVLACDDGNPCTDDACSAQAGA